jgi:crotonobetainyl-CoA:carnitine CoA-transferase CaiB-like acyl-CoA transferase
MTQQDTAMLSVFRVLDLTDECGFFGGKLLGDLGADVIKIEKPGGDPARRFGPFFDNKPHPEKSLFWMGLNSNKRGITLDLETAQGREIFKKLCQKADIVMESFAPGFMEELGLGYEALSDINPELVMASISGFGQTGPYKDYKAPAIILWALSGQAYITGDADRAPLSPSYPVSYFYGAMQAVIGVLTALYQRGTTGRGQYVDVPSILGAVWGTGSDSKAMWIHEKQIVKRNGRFWPRPQPSPDGTIKYVYVPLIYPCKDGSVKFFPFVDVGSRVSTLNLVNWVIEEGFASGLLKKVDWSAWRWEVVSQQDVDDVTGCFQSLFMAHTKAEIWEAAQKRKIMLYPVFTVKDLMDFPQLSIRNFWEKVEHPELGRTLTYPGAFTKLGEGSCGVRLRAPLIGEHNQDIYIKELGMTPEEMVCLKEAGVI